MIAAALGLAVIAAYAWGVRLYDCRFPERRFGAGRVVAFVAGTALMSAVLMPQMDALADKAFAMHMLQHMALLFAGPPFVLLGAPLLLVVAVPPPRIARRITAFAHGPFGRALFAPVTGWLLYVFVLWGTHFSSLYEYALEYPAIHVCEHVLYIFAAFLFWGAVVQVGYAPRPVPYAARMLYLFLAIPQGAFLGFALNATRVPLYRHYVLGWGSVPAALADQHGGADIMWILGGFLLFTAFMCTAAVWAASERGAATAT